MRVLACAFACSPTGNKRLGSGEAVLGWNVVAQIARFHQVDVLSHPSNRPGVESVLREQPNPSLAFHFFELPRWLSILQKLQGCFQIYAYLWQIQAYFVARRLHSQVRFDVFHHVTYANDWAASFIGAFLSVPYLRGPCGGAQQTPRPYLSEYAIHNRFWERFRYRMGWILRHDPFFIRSQKRARRILVCNRESLQALPGPLRAKATLFPVNGISSQDLRVIADSPAFAWSPNCADNHSGSAVRKGFLVLSAGRLIALKGYGLALRAFKLFAEGHPDAHLVILGDGPDMGRLKALARSLALQDRILFPGWADRERLLGALAACDVFLFPSFRDGGGAVVIEAMAAGKPVICLDLAGPGMHVNADCGIKLPASSPETTVRDIAQALDKLYRDPELRLRIGGNARRRVEQTYTWDHLGESLGRIYDELRVQAEAGAEAASPGRRSEEAVDKNSSVRQEHT